MHKMELGDSVYAAERIMKKRIRKVSFIFIILLTWTALKLAKAVVIQICHCINLMRFLFCKSYH